MTIIIHFDNKEYKFNNIDEAFDFVHSLKNKIYQKEYLCKTKENKE